ncbi:hypothetical protein BDZ45DRAFT_748778 [Acephala macrosclerotiorum]|nr:hypothetical protein BDZ45DRAFT_748778 [Acephala macrosclerotiorum]
MLVLRNRNADRIDGASFLPYMTPVIGVNILGGAIKHEPTVRTRNDSTFSNNLLEVFVDCFGGALACLNASLWPIITGLFWNSMLWQQNTPRFSNWPKKLPSLVISTPRLLLCQMWNTRRRGYKNARLRVRGVVNDMRPEERERRGFQLPPNQMPGVALRGIAINKGTRCISKSTRSTIWMIKNRTNTSKIATANSKKPAR